MCNLITEDAPSNLLLNVSEVDKQKDESCPVIIPRQRFVTHMTISVSKI